MNDFLQALALLEWRLASASLLSLALAGGFGMPAAWAALEGKARALATSGDYLQLIEGVEDHKANLLDWLKGSRACFNKAAIAWLVFGADTLLAMAVVPANPGEAPTWNCPFHLLLVLVAVGLSGQALLKRAKAEGEIDEMLSRALRHARSQGKYALKASRSA